MMAEGLYLLPGEEEQHDRFREAWIKAERAALDAERQRSKNGAEIVHNLICECGREHLIRLTVTGRHITQHVDCAQGSVRAEQDVARLRADWLRGEKALLAQHRAQLPTHSGVGSAILTEEPTNHSADAVRATVVSTFGVVNDRRKDNLKRVNARSGIFQRFGFFVVHVLALLRLNKPKPPIDSRQTKADKEAA